MIAVPMDPSLETFCLYDRRLGSSSYLTDFVLPGATRITCRIGERARRILNRVPSETTHFLFHIDLTRLDRVPRDRELLCGELRSRDIVVLNSAVTDLSKRAIQDTCERAGLPTTHASSTGPQDELLVVKTNRNFRGVPERRLRWHERTMLGIRKHTRLDPRWFEYPVLPRSEVPTMLFTDPEVIVERFVEDSKKSLFRAYVGGSNVVIGVHHVDARIKKASDAPPTKRWFLSTDENAQPRDERDAEIAPVIHAIERFVEAFSLDFGALDIVVDDEMNAHVIDVAVTPSMKVTGDIPDRWIYIRQGILGIERECAAVPA